MQEYKAVMKTCLQVSAVLILLLMLTGLAVGSGLYLAGAVAPAFGNLQISGLPRPFGAAFGLCLAAVAVGFALVVTAVALAGAFLAVLFALLLTGLILLAVALPFLLPLILPLGLIFVVLLATRPARHSRAT